MIYESESLTKKLSLLELNKLRALEACSSKALNLFSSMKCKNHNKYYKLERVYLNLLMRNNYDKVSVVSSILFSTYFILLLITTFHASLLDKGSGYLSLATKARASSLFTFSIL